MLNIALKEWSIMCDLLMAGETALLLRKGGIAEEAGPGRFEPAYDRFVLYPSWLHQSPAGVKPMYANRVEQFEQEPQQLALHVMAQVQGVWTVPSQEALEALDDLHIYSQKQVMMRWNYKPERPLYALLLRVNALIAPKPIQADEAYWGCRSWIELQPEHAVDEQAIQSEPVLSDAIRQEMFDRLQQCCSI